MGLLAVSLQSTRACLWGQYRLRELGRHEGRGALVEQVRIGPPGQGLDDFLEGLGEGRVSFLCHPDPSPFRCARPFAGRPRVSQINASGQLA